ncbi:MAG TPA: DUF58 domain-containing protein [Firmicutes bacterium]|nr:DUF58 domain-containing protein [Bacillota bacterium]
MIRDLLTNEYMARLDVLDLAVKKRLGGISAGARKSTAKGSSLEFSDFREYTQGDDLRRIDWNSYARFGRLYTKLFNEERQATVNIILDVSSSVRVYGEKRDYAGAFAASAAYIALNNSDMVNIFAVDSSGTDRCTALSSKKSFPRAVAFIEEALSKTEKTRTAINASVAALAGERLGEGISLIISDFFSDDGCDTAVKFLRSKKQGVILAQILDSREINFEERGNLRLVDSENGSFRELEITPEMLKRYGRALEEFKNGLKELALRNEAEYHFLDDSAPLLAAVGELVGR